MSNLRGLTLLHPFAFAIARLGKKVENRSWRPERHGGRVGMLLAIHGGVAPKGAKLAEAIADWRHVLRLISKADLDGGRSFSVNYLNDLSDTEFLWLQNNDVSQRAMITPGIVAVARLSGVVTDSPSRWAVPGQYHWQLSDVRPLPEPVAHTGARGLWTVSEDAVARIEDQLGRLEP